MGDRYLSKGFLGREQGTEATLGDMLGEDSYAGKTTATIKTACAGCGRIIEEKTAINAMGKNFHKECFKCTTCNKQIMSSQFTMNEHGQFKCEPCAKQEKSIAPEAKGKPTCVKCKAPIMQSGVKMGTNMYHKECYTCAICNQAFKTNKIAIDKVSGLPICEVCISQKKTLPASSTPQVSKSNMGLEELEKLADLKNKGILTEAEFQAKKKQILGL